MFTYLVVIYISFVVFLVIIVAVKQVLVPSLPTSVPVPDDTNRLGVDVTQFARLGSVDKAAYTLIFFHAAAIQGVCSGFIAGQLGSGSVKDGVKHAAAMLAVAYLTFLVLSSPVASMDFPEQTTAGETVSIESVSLSEGGFVVVHERNRDGSVIGRSAYLSPGTHDEVTVALDRPPSESETTLVAVPHLDTDDNGQYDYDGGELDRPYPEVGYQVAVPGDVEYDPTLFEDDDSESVSAPASGSDSSASAALDSATTGPGSLLRLRPAPTPSVATVAHHQ
jgi:flagellar protein FlaJ